ncbi:MRN complex-interacting protein [Episyrphus balteatus]|uniref:MRN complex-interacting protein n=1 Tax=Episyrphus balteatus TaxID=286459 RepID=UPI0024867EF8|nr:MRN complex-interacting protein [Episyrphus balteatus]XP_055841206.1 MRN complex-interacting protein [Episyrphus balteatus]
MPQEIRVLRCYKCKMYQVDIVKKAKKWQCKLCQEKQSVFKEFFRGSGADCRLKVQELNLNANTQKNEVENEFLSLLDRDDLDVDLEAIINEANKKGKSGQVKIEDSKWAKYVDDVQPEEQNIEPIEWIEPTRKAKRKSNSKPQSEELNCTKIPRLPLASTSSKWDKYL